MTEATHEAIQVLLDRPAGEGMIVSCYVDTSLSAGFPAQWPQRLQNEAAAIERRLADDRQALARFTRDMEVVRRVMAVPDVQRARGMALFSAAEAGLFQAFALHVPIRDRLVLDERPYVVPLLEALHRQRRYLLVLTDSHRGRLYEASWGRRHLLREIEEDVPKRQRSAGETWGKQQATIARHREDHLLHYRKQLAGAIEHAWPDAPFRGIILLGETETLDGVRAELPKALAGRIVHSARHSWFDPEPALDDAVQAVLDAALREHDTRLVAEIGRRLREHHLVAAGPQEVVNALRSGQVEHPGFLVLEPDRGEMAARCTRCGSIFTTAQATCAICQGVCERVNLWQEILLFAARHQIAAHTVEACPALSAVGGVAAALSRSEPWEPARPAVSAAPAVG